MVQSQYGKPPDPGSLITLFGDDDRPTFAIQPATSRVIFRNAALESLIASISNETHFRSWVEDIFSGPAHAHDQVPTELLKRRQFCNTYWTARAVGDVVLVHCAWKSRPGTSDQGVEVSKADRSRQRSLFYDSEIPSDWYLDWISTADTPREPWAKFLRQFDWSATKIGPISNWPAPLRMIVIAICNCPEPRMVIWGDEALMVFNAAARPTLGSQYHEVLGNSLFDTFGKGLANINYGCLREALREGRAPILGRQFYLSDRSGFPSECYADIHLVPIANEDGSLAGMVSEYVEITNSVLQERRSKLLSNVLHGLGQDNVKDTPSLWSNLVKAFEQSKEYIPLMVLYTRSQGESDEDPDGDTNHFKLQGAVGASPAVIISDVFLDPSTEASGLARAFESSSMSQHLLVTKVGDKNFPHELALNVQPQGLINAACILPITLSSDSEPVAFLSLGQNPRKPFEGEDLDLMATIRDIVSKAASIACVPEDQRDGAELARVNRDMAQELRILTAEKNAQTFGRMAYDAPFGMYTLDTNAVLSYVNQEFLRLTNFTSIEQILQFYGPQEWWRWIIPEQQLTAVVQELDAVKSGKPTTREFHVHKPIHPDTPDDQREYTGWIESTTFPERDASGNIVGHFAFLVDISDRKRAQAIQAQRLDDAVATKKAAESFIDMVSHETRNPLSAILQLASGLSNTFTPQLKEKYPELADVVDYTLDSAQTITLCAEHQRGILDDILVLSKLDSDLLHLLLEKVQPIELVRQAIKMHQSECAAAQITTQVVIDSSYEMLKLDYVMMDYKRSLQVILNLLGNAIKFTKTASTRCVTVTLAASTTRPTSTPDGAVFIEASSTSKGELRPAISRSDSMSKVEGDGDIFIQFAVTDSGRGQTEAEMHNLFQRFSQGSIKTFKEYGGSGLGLFISKRLSELQGGRIGAKSDGLDTGSTFAFYIKAKRCDGGSAVPDVPVQTVSSIPIRNANPSLPRQKSAAAATKQISVNGTKGPDCTLHVLLVEDNAINQKVMAMQLRRIGCTVHVADNGIEALRVLEQSSFHAQSATINATNGTAVIPLDVVLMDSIMPEMDGLECTARIRKLQSSGEIVKYVPIIAVTANARQEQINDAFESGVDHVVTKPFLLEQLVPLMMELVGRYAT